MFDGIVRLSEPVDGSSVADWTCEPNAASSASPAIGACVMKIACQLKASVSAPPSAGPSAAPNVPASVQMSAPLTCDRVSATRTLSDPARRKAAPKPWTQRALMSQVRSIRECTCHRGDEKDRQPGRHDDLGADPADDRNDRERHDGDDEVVRGDDPGDPDDRRVEVRVELGQGEHDDRRVGERHGDRGSDGGDENGRPQRLPAHRRSIATDPERAWTRPTLHPALAGIRV